MAQTIHSLRAIISANVAAFTRGIMQAVKDSSALRRAWGDAARDVSSASARITAAVGAMGVAIGARFGEFEATMLRVAAVTDTLGTEEFAKLEAAARKMGAETSFSAAQAAFAIEKLALAGLTTTEVIVALPGALQLAAAAQIEIADAAEIAAKTMRGFGADATELTHINDVFVATFSRANTDLKELAVALKYVAPVSKAAGVSLEDTSAALAKLADSAMAGSIGGTSLRKIISTFTGGTPEALAALRALGVETLDAAENMRPLFDILEDLEHSAITTGDIMGIFGDRAGPAMMALLEVGTEELREFSQALTDSGGRAERAANTQLLGLLMFFERLTSAIDELVMAAGTKLAPEMRKLINEMVAFLEANDTDIIDKMVSSVWSLIETIGSTIAAIQSVKPQLMALAGSISAVVGAISDFLQQHPQLVAALAALKVGSLLGINAAVASLGTALVSTATFAIPQLIAAVRALSMALVATGPIGIALGVVALIAGLVAAVLQIEAVQTALQPLKDAFSSVWQTFSPILGAIWDGFNDISTILTDELGPTISAAAAQFQAELAPAFAEMQAAVKGLFAELGKLAYEFGDELAGALKELLPFLVDVTVGFIRFHVDVLKAILPAITELAKVGLPMLIGALQAFTETLKFTIGFVTGFVDAFTGLNKAVREFLGLVDSAEEKAARELPGDVEDAADASADAGMGLGDAAEEAANRAAMGDAATAESAAVGFDFGAGAGPDGATLTPEQQDAQQAAREAADRQTAIDEQLADARGSQHERQTPGFGELSEFLDLQPTEQQLRDFMATSDQFSQALIDQAAGIWSSMGQGAGQTEEQVASFTQAMLQRAQAEADTKARTEESTQAGADFARQMSDMNFHWSAAPGLVQGFKDQFAQLQQDFVNGTITADEFATATRGVADAARDAAEASRQQAEEEKRKRILAGDFSDLDPRKALEDRMFQFRMQQFNGGIDAMFNGMMGFSRGASSASAGIGQFTDSLSGYSDKISGMMSGGGNLPSLPQAADMIAKFMSSTSGMVANLQNQIALLQQNLNHFGDKFGARFRIAVGKQIDELQRQINALLRPVQPQFTGSYGPGWFADPGLQSGDGRNGGGPEGVSNSTLKFEFPNVTKFTNQDAERVYDMLAQVARRRGQGW